MSDFHFSSQIESAFDAIKNLLGENSGPLSHQLEKETKGGTVTRVPTWKGFTSRPFPFSPLRSVHTRQYSFRGCLQIPKTRGPSVSSLPPTHCVLVEGSPPHPPRHHRGMVGFHVCPSPAEPFLDLVFYRPENC